MIPCDKRVHTVLQTHKSMKTIYGILCVWQWQPKILQIICTWTNETITKMRLTKSIDEIKLTKKNAMNFYIHIKINVTTMQTLYNDTWCGFFNLFIFLFTFYMFLAVCQWFPLDAFFCSDICFLVCMNACNNLYESLMLIKYWTIRPIFFRFHWLFGFRSQK